MISDCTHEPSDSGTVSAMRGHYSARTITAVILAISLCIALKSFSQTESPVAPSIEGLVSSGGTAQAVAPFPFGQSAEQTGVKGIFQIGGQWLTNPPAWYVSAETPEGEGSLFIVLDRSVLAADQDMTIELNFADKDGSSLYVDLLATNCVTVGTNLYGNLIEGSNEVVCLELPVPLSESPRASIVRLWRGVGDVLVFESQLTARKTGERHEEAIIRRESREGIAVMSSSSLSDGRESALNGSRTGPAVVENLSSKSNEKHDRIARVSDRPGRLTIHVNVRTGDDEMDGLSVERRGQSGPKRTIPAALSIAEDGDAITVAPGTYDGNVSFCGKNVDVVITGDVVFK